jgi:hypothetical protein
MIFTTSNIIINSKKKKQPTTIQKKNLIIIINKKKIYYIIILSHFNRQSTAASIFSPVFKTINRHRQTIALFELSKLISYLFVPIFPTRSVTLQS